MNRWLRRWHRWIGLLVALMAMELAVTGILLNHTDDLALAQKPLTDQTVLGWYGIRAPKDIPAYRADGHWVSQWGQQLFVDDQLLPNPPDGRLLGAVGVQGLIAVAWPDRVWLVTPAGQLAMSWGAATDLPQPVTAIGSDGERIHVRAGSQLLITDPGLMSWQAADADIGWSQARPLPPSLHDRIAPQYLGHSVSWERLLLDLHSGRLFGHAGIWVVDAAGVLIGLLGISGVWIWWLGRRARRRSRSAR